MTHRHAACAALTIASLLSGQATVLAELTPIANSPDQFDEPNLFGTNPFPGNINPSIIEQLYGEANVLRIDDAVDQIWKNEGGSAAAVARFTGERLQMGVVSEANGELTRLFSLVGRGFEVAGEADIPLEATGEYFQLALLVGSSIVRYSVPTEHNNNRDRMVTYRIVGNEGHPQNVVGNYVVGWEDRGDFDFQDGVFELSGVRPVPEPSSITVVLIGLWVVIRRDSRFTQYG